MKKIISLSILSTITLTGCMWPRVDGAPIYGVDYDQPSAVQPQYKYEEYNQWDVSAVERSSIDKDVDNFNQNSSYKMQEALRKSIVEVKQKYPNVFRSYKKFLVGSLVNADDINKSEKVGRISGMGLTNAIGKTASAKYIRYNRNMIAVENKMLVPTDQSKTATKAFASDALVLGVYKIKGNDIMIRYAFYDADTLVFLAEGSATIPMNHQTSKFALEI